jgi:hypothetical protein
MLAKQLVVGMLVGRRPTRRYGKPDTFKMNQSFLHATFAGTVLGIVLIIVGSSLRSPKFTLAIGVSCKLPTRANCCPVNMSAIATPSQDPKNPFPVKGMGTWTRVSRRHGRN